MRNLLNINLEARIKSRYVVAALLIAYLNVICYFFTRSMNNIKLLSLFVYKAKIKKKDTRNPSVFCLPKSTIVLHNVIGISTWYKFCCESYS